DIEAFQHAVAANDIDRAERLIRGRGIPLHFRGAVTTILDWLESLPKTELDARPALWAAYASLLLVNGQTTGVEEKLQAAEAALTRTEQGTSDSVLSPQSSALKPGTEVDDKIRPFIGQIANARAVLALTRY